MAKKHKFKAEIRQLLDILVHSLYTNREIFIRELISNSSDALDKLRFEQLRGGAFTKPEVPLEILIHTDEEARRLVIEDTGVGMTAKEVKDNIGTIARSGTSAFLGQVTKEQAKAAKADDKESRESHEDSVMENIIGKFGVGFYSVFMVAEEVVLTTRSYKPDSAAVRWRSDGLGTYEIEELDPKEESGEEGGGDAPPARGTRIEIRLKEENKEYASRWRVEQAIKTHSNFISFPIKLDGQQVNTTPALWREPKFKITPERYAEFFKFLTFDEKPPFETLHISVDTPVQFNALLFIPESGLDLQTLRREVPGIDLYSRRVLIQRGTKDLLPEYLGFVRGVVDSEDLPLNISRETLQENLVLNKIGQSLTDKLLSRLETIAKNDPARYDEFFKAQGQVFRLGYSDFRNRERYAKLLRFNSSHCDDEKGLVSLTEYKERAKEGQKAIYFVAGQSRAAAALNPHTEIFRRKGLEVLYLYDPLEEFALESLGKFDDFELLSVEKVDAASLESFESRDDAESPPAQPALSEEDTSRFNALLEKMKAILDDRVTEVRVSERLSTSPACLASPDGTMSSSMQKILRIVNQETSPPKRVLEVNRDHPLLRGLLKLYQHDPEDRHLKEVVEQLFESSLLLEGYLEDPHAMVARIQSLLERATEWQVEALPK